MKTKRVAAALIAAVASVAATPATDMLPVVMSVNVGAEEIGDMDSNVSFRINGYDCTLLDDGTIKVCINANIENFTDKLEIPGQINGYTVTEIGSSCKGSFSSVTIPDSVRKIDDFAFEYYCPELQEVKFGENSQLEIIGGWAFNRCPLKSVTIPANVKIIGEGAFLPPSDNPTLTEVKFAENSKLETIDAYAFSGQTKLKEILLPDSLKEIGYQAFVGCCGLTEVTIPVNVNTIVGGNPINSNFIPGEKMNISKIKVDSNNQYFKSVDGVLFTKDGKTIIAYPAGKAGEKYEIPPTVNTIAESAFDGCHKLNSVTVPEGVESIPYHAFYNTSLLEIRLPKSISTIDEFAFEKTRLLTVYGVLGSYAEEYARENNYKFKDVGLDSSDSVTDIPESTVVSTTVIDNSESADVPGTAPVSAETPVTSVPITGSAVIDNSESADVPGTAPVSVEASVTSVPITGSAVSTTASGSSVTNYSVNEKGSPETGVAGNIATVCVVILTGALAIVTCKKKK